MNASEEDEGWVEWLVCDQCGATVAGVPLWPDPDPTPCNCPAVPASATRIRWPPDAAPPSPSILAEKARRQLSRLLRAPDDAPGRDLAIELLRAELRTLAEGGGSW